MQGGVFVAGALFALCAIGVRQAWRSFSGPTAASPTAQVRIGVRATAAESRCGRVGTRRAAVRNPKMRLPLSEDHDVDGWDDRVGEEEELSDAGEGAEVKEEEADEHEEEVEVEAQAGSPSSDSDSDDEAKGRRRTGSCTSGGARSQGQPGQQRHELDMD